MKKSRMATRQVAVCTSPAGQRRRSDNAEFDGGLPRARAEARAFVCCMAEWLNRNFVRSPPGRCLACEDNFNPVSK
jgi:hypothetical protein